jgi:hypothetical protein
MTKEEIPNDTEPAKLWVEPLTIWYLLGKTATEEPDVSIFRPYEQKLMGPQAIEMSLIWT